MAEYKTIVVSDVHLGNPYSNWKLLKKFLEENKTQTLFLNGDFVDEKYLINNNKSLSSEEEFFLKWIMNIEGTNTIYIHGNHEYPSSKMWKEYDIDLHEFFIYRQIINNFHYRTLISHGHLTTFKNPIVNNKYIIRLVDYFIRLMAGLQKIHKGLLFRKGSFEVKEGVEFQILSDWTKDLFKSGLKIVSRYKSKIKRTSNNYNVGGVINGHIHHPEIKTIKKIKYMNSGDWLENNSALVQDDNGNWKIIYKKE